MSNYADLGADVRSLWRTEREPRLMQNEAEFLVFNLLSKEYAW